MGVNKVFTLILAHLISLTALFSQGQDSLAQQVLTPGIHYGINLPGMDLKSRFGPFFGFGPQLDWSQRNWLARTLFTYYFGSPVKEDVLQPLRSTDGFIVGNGQLLPVFLRMRGWSVEVMGGRRINIHHSKLDLGLLLGSGWLAHRIRILDESQSHPLLTKPYSSGFDRLSRGPLIKAGLTLRYKASSRAWFTMDVNYAMAWTRLQRHYQYDQQPLRVTSQDDIRTFKLGWVWPIALNSTADRVYY